MEITLARVIPSTAPVDFPFIRRTSPVEVATNDVSRHEQICQCRHNEQPITVLHHAAIADLGKAKEALDDEKACSTLARTLYFLLFFSRSRSVSPLLRNPFWLVKSRALGAAWAINFCWLE